VPRARDSGAPDDLAFAVIQILPSTGTTASAIATIKDFGAGSSRPTSLLSTLQPPPVTQREARLATGLPATALTGLDFHQLDSYERFHQLILNSPFPSLAWRDVPDFFSRPESLWLPVF
jgi:hypothetical protein